MTYSAASTTVAESRSVLSDDQLARLARTYDRVSSPIWVYDRSSRCIYRNFSAKRTGRVAASRLTFEILDHNGRTVGHLATVRG